MLYAVALKRWETLAHGCILAAVSSLDWNSLDLSGVHPSSDLRARACQESLVLPCAGVNSKVLAWTAETPR